MVADRLEARRDTGEERRATVLDLTNAGRTILTELITLRTKAIRAITDQMSKHDRDALLRGADAFTTAQHQLSDHLYHLPDSPPPVTS